MRRSFFKKSLLSLAGLGLLPFMGLKTQSEAKKPKKIKGDFIHMVFFWLKNPDSDADRSEFLSELNGFIDNMDVIVAKHIGKPADTRRPVIDSSYTFSLVVTFKNAEDQDIYQEHPLHKKFIDNASGLWEKVVVYDSLQI